MFLPVNITLQFGDTGDFVAELQRRLSTINLFNEGLINATYDSNTVNAVKSFQSMQGLRVDGIAGPETLRRLSGVMTGDTSNTSSGDKKEEEQRVQQAAMVKDAFIADTLTTAIDPTLSAAPAQAEEKPVEKPAVAAAPPPRNDMQPPPQDVAKASALHDMINVPPPPQPERNPQLEAQQQQQMDALKQQQEAAKHQQVQPKPTEPPKPVEPKVEKPKEEPQPERKPLSAMLQKLVDYIESKLPRSVVDEVKAIGQTMAKAGVREVAMPAGDAPAPAIEAGRGQQQQPQR